MNKTVGRPSKWAAHLIHIKHKGPNPRRKGSRGRRSFNLMREGMSYEEYIELGGRALDLNNDIAAGYIVMTPKHRIQP